MKVKLVNENFKKDYLNQLLLSRGVTDLNAFYNPSDDLLQDPIYLDNIDKGAELYRNVIGDINAHVGIVVDSDVDGYTSAAIMYLYTKELNSQIQIDYFIHSHKQHGLEDLIDQILNSNIHYDLIICPDSSSNDYEYHEMLREVGTPVLVLDHHEVDNEISSNAVVINNQMSESYYNKNLSGAGVAWQFCRYIDRLINSSKADKYIDLAALGCISDMMSCLEMENRYLFTEGLRHIHNGFFKALVAKQSFSIGDELTPIGVAFYITPLINSLIRVGTPEEKELAFRAFVEPHELIPSQKRGAKGTLEEISIEVARIATNTRARQNRILDKAVEELEIKINKFDLLSNQIIFIELDEEDYPQELTGLIAMKISAKYKHPTMIGRLGDSYGNDHVSVPTWKGSIRGLNESELKDFKGYLTSTGLFDYVQGHANAAGFGINALSVDNFIKQSNKDLAQIDFAENYFEVNFKRIAADPDLEEMIFDLGGRKDIWGQQNNEPLIYVQDLNLKRPDIQIMGKNSDTVKINKFGISYIKFHAKDMIEELARHDEVKMEIVGKPNINEFMGRITPQIFIEDYQIEDGTLGF